MSVGEHREQRPAAYAAGLDPRPAGQARDPVCGMNVDPVLYRATAAPRKVDEVASISGKGVTGRIAALRVAADNTQLLEDLGQARAQPGGATVMFVAVDGRAAGIIAVADPIKTTTPAALANLRAQGVRIVMLTGDNRTTAEADAGVAMGTGTEATMRSIRQNLLLAFLYNGLAIPLAAGVLYPSLGWLLSPMVAAAAMSFSSVSVIGNSLRLRFARL